VSAESENFRSWRCRIGWHDWQWRILWGVGAGDNMDAECSRCTASHERIWVRGTCRSRKQEKATRLHPLVVGTAPPSPPAGSGVRRA
jgi:hypothetical protein